MWISRSAAVEPAAFIGAVGTGLVCKASSLPRRMLAELPFSVQQDELSDTFGHRLNVAISKIDGIQGGLFKYELFIWSDGPNGRNENRRGDDISTTGVVVEVPN